MRSSKSRNIKSAKNKRSVFVKERLRFEKQIEKQQKNLNKKLNINSGLSIFAAGVAHEFNNILGAADGHAEWALESLQPDEMRKALEVVRLACRRSAEITKSLQGLFQPYEEEMKVFSLSLLVKDLTTLFSADFRSQKVEFHFDKFLDCKIYANPTRIFEVFVNITRNALSVLSTLPEGSKRAFEISSKISKGKNPKICVLFCDSGPGVAPVYREAIFAPFFTTKGVLAHVDTRTNQLAVANEIKENASDDINSQKNSLSLALSVEGSGLGLFLSSQIAQEHGGSLRLLDSSKNSKSYKNQAHQGAILELVLPCAT